MTRTKKKIVPLLRRGYNCINQNFNNFGVFRTNYRLCNNTNDTFLVSIYNHENLLD